MKKEIMLPNQVKKKLEKDFKTTAVSVWNALTFQTNSAFANMIRVAALERGGKLYDGSSGRKNDTVDFETIYETADGIMIQKFSERVKIIADFTNKKIGVYVDEELRVVSEDMDIASFMQLQDQATQAANELK